MTTSSKSAICCVLVCIVAAVTLTYTADLQEVEEEAAKNLPPNIRYLLNNMENDGVSLQAPPQAYVENLKRYFHDKSKRNGFWIWMPAQGYVSMPNEQIPGGASKSQGGGSVLRYG